MALLAVVDIDDQGTLKIERFTDALESLGASVRRTSEQVNKSGKESEEGTRKQTDALTKLLNEQRAYQAEVIKQIRNTNDLVSIMKAGTAVTKEKAEALKVLNQQVQQSSFLTQKQKKDFDDLTQSLRGSVTVSAQQAAALKTAAAAHQQAAAAALGHSTAMKTLSNTVMGVVEAIGAAGLSYWLKGIIKDSFDVAARNQVLATSMGIVAKNTGYTNVAFETQAESIRRLGITTRESRDAVISFAQAELSLADAAKLARASQDLAAIAGLNSSESFNRIKAAIETGQPMLLRQFGIMQNLNKLYADQARELGTTAQALTTYEKRNAIVNLVLKEAEKVSGAYVATMNDVGKAMGSTRRLVEEVENVIGQAYVPIMKILVDQQNEWLESMAKMGPVSAAVVAGLIATVAGVAALVAVLRTLIVVLNLAGLSATKLQASMGWISLIATGLGLLVTAWMAYTAATEYSVQRTVENIAKIDANIISLNDMLKKVEQSAEKVKKAQQAGEGLAEAQNELQRSVNKLNAVYPGLINFVDIATGKYNLNADAIARVRGEMEKLAKKEEDATRAQAAMLTKRLADQQKLYDQMTMGKNTIGDDMRGTAASMGLLNTPMVNYGQTSFGPTASIPTDKGAIERVQKQMESTRAELKAVMETVDAFDKRANPLLATMDRLGKSFADIDPKILDRAIKNAKTSMEDLKKLTGEDLDKAIAKVKAQVEQIEQNSAKFQKAYQNAYEAITQTAATSGAVMKATNDALGDVSQSSDEYIERLMRAEGTLKSMAKMAPDEREKFANAAKAFDQLKVSDLLKDLEEWEKKAKQVADSVSASMTEMFRNMAIESANARIEASHQLEDTEISYFRTTEARNEELNDRVISSYERAVDQKIKENDRWFRAFKRGIEDEIRMIERRQADEARLSKQKYDEDVRSLNRTIENAQREFQIKVENLERFERIRKAIDSKLTEDEVKNLIRNEKIKFDEKMGLLQKQGLAEIAARLKQDQDIQAARKKLDDQYIKDQEAVLEKAEDAHQKTNDQILKDHDYTWHAIADLAKGFVNSALAGLGDIASGTRSWKDTMLGIFNSLKASVMRIFTDITNAAVNGFMGIGTQGKGIGGVKEALGGLFGRPAGGGYAPGEQMGIPGIDGAAGGAGGSWMHPQMSPGLALVGGGLMAASGAISMVQQYRSGNMTKMGGMMSGMQTGAGIGTMIMPGIGTAIGAGVGAIGGLIAGAISQRNAGRKAAIEFANSFDSSLTDNLSGFDELQKKLDNLKDKAKGTRLWREVANLHPGDKEAMEKTINEIKDAFALEDAQKNLPQVFSQVMALKKQADAVGFDLHKLYDAKSVSEYNAAQTDLNTLLEKQQTRLAGLSKVMEGFAMRVQGFSMKLKQDLRETLESTLGPDAITKLRNDYEDWSKDQNKFKGSADVWRSDKEIGFSTWLRTDGANNLSEDQRAKLAEVQGGAQKTFNSLTSSAGSVIADVLRETGDLPGALAAAGGAFKELIQIQKDWGFETSESFERLKSLYTTIEDNQDVVLSIQGIKLELEGLGDAGMLTKDKMNALGGDLSDQFAEMEKRGVSLDDRLMLMQPTLQTLWEAQQRFGFETDETTQKLIDMGVEHGIVGEGFKEVNQKILDVLLLIADALGADIPEGLRNLKKAKDENLDPLLASGDELEYQFGHKIPKSLDEAGSAVRGFGDFAKRMFREVGDEASAISLGHSPGGLKEIKLKVNEAVPAIRLLHSTMGMLKDSTGYATGAAAGIGKWDVRDGGGTQAGGGVTYVTIAPVVRAEVLDGSDLEQGLESRIMPKMNEILEANASQIATTMSGHLSTAARRR